MPVPARMARFRTSLIIIAMLLIASVTLIPGTTTQTVVAGSAVTTASVTSGQAIPTRESQASPTLSTPQAPTALPHFLKLPFLNPNVKFQQGWLYGCPGSLCGRAHEGIDYINGTIDNSGTWQPFEVTAAADGVATLASAPTSWGNYVYVQHTVGTAIYYTLYAHLASSPLVAGTPTTVHQGQVIGIAGSTGDGANGVLHLHFEFSVGNYGRCGCRVDPYDLQDYRPAYPQPGATAGATSGANYAWTDTRPTYAFPHVTLFDSINYDSGAGTISFANTGFYNLSTFNDRTASLVLPDNWVIKVYENADRGGGYKVFEGSDRDLSDDSFNNGVPVKNRISSVDVFWGVCVPGAPVRMLPDGTLSACSTPTPIATSPPTATATPPQSGITIISAWPQGASVNAGQTFNPEVIVQTNGFSLNCNQDFLDNRDGNLYNTWPTQGCVDQGNQRYRIYFNTPMQAPSSSGEYHSAWQIWHYPNHVGPQIDIWFRVPGPNHSPPTPTLLRPTDWTEVRSTTAPELCWNPVSDPDGDSVQYWAEVYESAVIANSGWINGTCWTPHELDGHYFGYQWRVKARDTRGGESGWSATWHFGLTPPPYNPPHPVSTPPPLPALPTVTGAWWDAAYQYRRPITITTNSILPTGLMMVVDQFDVNTLVAQGKVRPDFQDVRVVRRLSDYSWQEVARQVWAAQDVEFFLAAPITQPVDTTYYLYYGNPTAATPPSYTLTQGYWVSHYLDKWWTSFHSIWEHSDAINSNDVCGPPIDHRTHTGSSFDDSDVYDGRIFIPSTGVWTFREYTNDGWALYIDDIEIGRNDGYDGNRWVTVGSATLTAGWHRFSLPDMWVNCGGMVLTMAGPNFSDQVVPANYYQRWYGNMQTGLPLGGEQGFSNATLTPTPTQTATATPTAPPTATFTATPIPGQLTVLSGDLPKNVPDNGQTTSTLVIGSSPPGSITDVDVFSLNINHTWIQDLEVRLTSPQGTTVVLFNGVCHADQDISYLTVDDEATQALGSACPPTPWGAYRSQEALSRFQGENPIGTWTLTVIDHGIPDTGVLTAWGLRVRVAEAPPCTMSFSDVQPTDYFYTPVQYLACHRVIGGYSDGTFRPYNNTTRGQLSKMVVGARGWAINTAGGPHFSDVPPDSTFYSYIETAVNHGIISGYADGTFRPGANITRGQLSKIVVGAQGWTLTTAGGPHFTDLPAADPFYAYVETAFAHGIINGYADGTFRPSNSATRAQISKIVYLATTNP